MNNLIYFLNIIDSKFSDGSKLKYEEAIKVINAILSVTEEKTLKKETADLDNHAENTRYKEVLSKREMQVFGLVGRGFTTSVIAHQLNISNATVSTHRKNIIKKLSLKGQGKLQTVAFLYVKNEIRKA
ncbi:response regulator containing a CheY-like receiver domain and an HTH DNA-binding domain [Aequorivita sublithincola DSM 14238]|uniref:Response regulator containing a CheY-like receiver domain and an HTH DNA-binding domain n=1 Tax=Aequorivita sublithincola (strain DSM 14238 / LMG 21431 / ACAM 643 / 9-3) TaxID=746697 RepID=I3YSB8_AEQSU|nr:LuxR C-terminal-related transcriptional regulator [Aequorivita sublithincola]AFL79886.1 response regulator containing a CheY-like receiver domain and an HTH DNA-binding domain [Aequorivita sublithincola DSM 14238]